MKCETFLYSKTTGWSLENFPDMDSEHTLILVFASPCFLDMPEPIQALSDFYPRSSMIGCSTAGEILGSSISYSTISVAVIQFEKTKIRVTNASVDGQQFIEAGEKISQQLEAPDLKNIFVLSEGVQINGTELINGLNKTLRPVIITGGMAADNDLFKQTWTIFNGKILMHHVVAVGFYGVHINIGYGSKGGWDSFGMEKTITRSKNNILYELDNKPALAIYKQYLGKLAAGLPATGLLFPLAIRKNETDTKYLVRTILAYDETEQSLTFGGDIPIGYLAKLMRGTFDHIITGAYEAAEYAKSMLPDPLQTDSTKSYMVIAVSCIGRRLLLGNRIEEETEAVTEALAPNFRLVGFYSYGELSPHNTVNDTCDLHNQTMTLTIIGEN